MSVDTRLWCKIREEASRSGLMLVLDKNRVDFEEARMGILELCSTDER